MFLTDGDPAATTTSILLSTSTPTLTPRRRNLDEHEHEHYVEPAITQKTTHNHNCPTKKTENENGNDAPIQKETALSVHCAAFDLSHSGIIYPYDTYRLCRSWSWSFPLALFFAGAIHFVQSYGTAPTLLPDLYWRIYLPNIPRNKHGSSSASFSATGAFDPQRLHAFFTANDDHDDRKGGLTARELWDGLKEQGLPLDLYGQVSAFFEWLFAFVLVWPVDGVLREEDARKVCTGEMFALKAEGGGGCGKEYAHASDDSSLLMKKKLLSLLIVDSMILPAIGAGMCYFMLRAVDDVVEICAYARKKTRTQKTQGKTKRKTGCPDPREDLEAPHPSAAGILGLVIIAGLTKLILMY